jgi:hypothetical protein
VVAGSLESTTMTAVLRPDFLEALRRLARVFDAYQAKTGSRPVLVGGAAASIYTGGMITSGDFDVVAAADEIFDGALADHGFVREDRTGYLLVGHYHPDIPTIGVQLVSGRLFEGRTDPSPSFRSRTAGRSLWHRSRI